MLLPFKPRWNMSFESQLPSRPFVTPEWLHYCACGKCHIKGDEKQGIFLLTH